MLMGETLNKESQGFIERVYVNERIKLVEKIEKNEKSRISKTN